MKRSPQPFACPGASTLFYRAALPLSRATLLYAAGVIRRHRRQLGSCWRKLNPGQQALLVLVHLRKGETFAELAAGFGVSTATAWRYVTETVRLLAARAPSLRTAVRAAKKAGRAFVVIDGTLIPVDRLAADRPFYSGKHRKHGMNLEVIASPEGEILWVSGPLPGATHDLTAARIWGILRELAAAGLIVLAGKGYTGAGDPAITPYRGRNKPASQKEANRAHARLRAPGERANAQLKTWRILRKLRCCPWRAGQLAKAIHVLQSYETAGCRVGGWRGGTARRQVLQPLFPGFPPGPLHCSDHGLGLLRFQPRRSNRACGFPAHGSPTPFTAGIRLVPPGLPALGATTIPYKLIRPNSAGRTCEPAPTTRKRGRGGVAC